MKYVDIDALFEKYLRERILKSAEKRSMEEWEDKIPELYAEFGAESFAELDGKTPDTYYDDVSGAELVGALCEQLEKGQSVSEYLCAAIVCRADAEEPLIALLDCGEEEKTMYALNLLGEMSSDAAVPKCVELAAFGDGDEHVKELAAELLSAKCEVCKEQLLRLYGGVTNDAQALFCDVLSRCARDGADLSDAGRRFSDASDADDAVFFFSRALRRRTGAARAVRGDRKTGHRFRGVPRTEIRHRNAGRGI